MLVEFSFLCNQIGLTRVDYLILRNMILEILDYLDSEVEIVLSMGVDQLTDVLSLVRAFLDDLAVVLEQVVDEELVEFFRGTSA